MSQNKINEFLDDLKLLPNNPHKRVLEIRNMFLKANPHLLEKIMYGGLTFHSSAGLLGGIFSYKAHISVEFSDGANFPDPEGLLEGGGKRRRHLKIRSFEDIKNKKTAAFVHEAVAEQT